MAITTVEALRHLLNSGKESFLEADASNDSDGSSSSSHSELHLELGGSTNMRGLTTEIQKIQKPRQKILVIGSDDDFVDLNEPDWTSLEAKNLFHALGGLPGIREIRLRDVGITYGPQGLRFPAALLTKLLQPTIPEEALVDKTIWTPSDLQPKLSPKDDSLERLVLSLRMHGSQEDIQELADCLASRKSLRHVAWEEWSFSPDDEALFDWNVLVKAISNLPELESLSIKAMTVGSPRVCMGKMTTNSMAKLCQSPTLKRLELVHLHLPKDAIHFVSNSLRRNQTNLEMLALDLSQTSALDACELFESLRHNTTLRELHIWASTHPNWAKENCLVRLADALTHNYSLKHVIILSHSRTLQEAIKNIRVVDDRIAAAFVRTLEANCQIESLVLDDYGEEEEHLLLPYDSGSASSCSATRVEGWQRFNSSGGVNSLAAILLFYLAWNESRRRPFDTISQTEWFDALTKVAHGSTHQEIQLEVLYYLMRLNPASCLIH